MTEHDGVLVVVGGVVGGVVVAVVVLEGARGACLLESIAWGS